MNNHIRSLFVLVTLFSCDDDPPESPTENPVSSRFVMLGSSMYNDSYSFGRVSEYNYTSDTVASQVFFWVDRYPTTVLSSTMAGDTLFAFVSHYRDNRKIIEAINTESWRSFRTISNISDYFYEPKMAIHNNRLLVAAGTSLLVYNKTTFAKDSVNPGESPGRAKAIHAHGDKIYISYYTPGATSEMLVLNGSNYEKLKKFDLPDICENIESDLNGNVLAFYKTGYVKINGSTLTFSSVQIPEADIFTTEVPPGNVYPGPQGSSFALDKENNILYYFSQHFMLTAFDLTNEKPLELTFQTFTHPRAIGFNSISKLIVVGDQNYPGVNSGRVWLFNPRGEPKGDFKTPAPPLYIFFQQD